MFKILKMVVQGNVIKLFRIVTISVIEAIFSSIPFVVLYFILCDIIDKVFTMDRLVVYVSVIVGSALIRMLFSFMNVVVSRADGTLMIKDLRLRLGEHVRKLSLGFFNTHNVGELSSRILDNVNRIEMMLTMLLPGVISTFVLSLLVGCGLLFIDVRMALVTVITIPLALVILSWARTIMAKQGKALFASSEKLSTAVLEFVNGIKFIKSFNKSQKKFNDLVETMDEFKEKSLKTEGALSPVMVIAGVFIDFGLVLLLLVGTYFLSGGSLSVKAFLIFVVISSRFFENIKSLAVNYVKLRYLLIAGQSVKTIFDEKLPSGTGNGAEFSNHNIDFKDVAFAYHGNAVLKNINLHIEEKKLTALVGPSGSGKTTITNLIARFFDVDKGTLLLGGHNVNDIDPEVLLKEISLVFQNVILFQDTIYNNIKVGKHDATKAEIVEAAKKANCHEFISELPKGYDTLVGENGANLSGGEQQRLSIARAILKDAPIILLDEATASLDPENEIFIQNAISRLLENKTVVVIAHRLKTIKNANNIVVFDDGIIKEQGKHQQLLANKAIYYQMWQSQQNSIGWKVKN